MNYKSLLVLLTFLFFGLGAQAQSSSRKESAEEQKARMEKINNAKIAFITEKLSLSTDQAQRFWSIYNEHNDKKQELKTKVRSFREENLNAMTEEQVKARLESRLAYRKKELELETEYMNHYLKVISAKQLAMLHRTEREFTKMLLERLQTTSRR